MKRDRLKTLQQIESNHKQEMLKTKRVLTTTTTKISKKQTQTVISLFELPPPNMLSSVSLRDLSRGGMLTLSSFTGKICWLMLINMSRFGDSGRLFCDFVLLVYIFNIKDWHIYVYKEIIWEPENVGLGWFGKRRRLGRRWGRGGRVDGRSTWRAHDSLGPRATLVALTHHVVAFGARVDVEQEAFLARIARSQRERFLFLYIFIFFFFYKHDFFIKSVKN